MTKACRDAGLPEPVPEEVGSGFRVTFGLIPVQKASLDPLDQKILDLLKDSSGRSTSQVADGMERSTRATRVRLKRLVELGLIRAEVSYEPSQNFFVP